MLGFLRFILPGASIILWWGGMITLYVRTAIAYRQYINVLQPDIPGLKDNPYLYPLYLPNYYPKYRQMRRDVRSAVWRRQTDPVRERLRRRLWRRYFAMFLWMFGFPLVLLGLIALLYFTTGANLLLP